MKQHRFIVRGLLTFQAVLLAWSGYRHSPTVDEPAHLAAGISHWQHGLTDLYAVNPPLVRMVAAIPMLAARPKTSWTAFRSAEKQRAEFTVGDALVKANGADIFRLMTLARWAVIPLVLLGGWVCWRWAGELFGPSSGLLALLIWCVSPNILAHGSLITADAASASVGLTAAWLFWHWLKQRTVLNAVSAGVALGVGLLVKSTLILFCGLVRHQRDSPDDQSGDRRDAATRSRRREHSVASNAVQPRTGFPNRLLDSRVSNRGPVARCQRSHDRSESRQDFRRFRAGRNCWRDSLLVNSIWTTHYRYRNAIHSSLCIVLVRNP